MNGWFRLECRCSLVMWHSVSFHAYLYFSGTSSLVCYNLARGTVHQGDRNIMLLRFIFFIKFIFANHIESSFSEY